MTAVHSALPKAKILGPDGMCTSAWATTVPVLCTVATQDMKAYPGGKQFLAAYKKQYNVSSPDPYSIYGYASAELGIQTLAKLPAGLSGAKLRSAFVKQLFKTKNLKSVLGTFSINSNGDTTLPSYGLYKLTPTKSGKSDTQVFSKTLKPPKVLKTAG